MGALLKGVIQIAGGIVVGGLMSDAVNKAVEVSKKVIVEAKKK